MALLSLVFLGLVVADLAAPPDAPYRAWLDEASLALWGVFVAEFLLRLAIAPDHALFLRRHWFDVLVLAVPMLRWLRVAALARVLRGTRGLRAMSIFRLASATRRGSRALARFLHASRAGYVAALTAVVVPVAAAGMLLIERDAPGSPIRSYPDALWWSASLMTTIGSDLQPVTGTGRVLAVALMTFAMVVFGYLIGHAAAFLQQGERARPG